MKGINCDGFELWENGDGTWAVLDDTSKDFASLKETIVYCLESKMFKNMKIPVKNNLDEIVVELERLGYHKEYESDEINYAITFNDGAFGLMTFDVSDYEDTTTLAELKEM